MRCAGSIAGIGIHRVGGCIEAQAYRLHLCRELAKVRQTVLVWTVPHRFDRATSQAQGATEPARCDVEGPLPEAGAVEVETGPADAPQKDGAFVDHGLTVRT